MKKYYLYLFCVMTGLLFVACEKGEDRNHNLGSIEVEGTLRNGEECGFSLNATGLTEIKRVEYWLTSTASPEGKKIGESSLPPFLVKFTPKDLLGDYTVQVKVEAANENDTYVVPAKEIHIRLSVGEPFQGGTLVVVDSNGQHGLIASDTDMIGGDRTLFQWGPSEGLGVSRSDGFANTTVLAAKAQNNFEMGYWFKKSFAHNGYEDWYIPSLEEGKTLKSNKTHLKNIKNRHYWTSSEMSGEYASVGYFIDFVGDYNDAGMKKDTELLVRLVRKF